jgi:two-component system response regulator FixJ
MTQRSRLLELPLWSRDRTTAESPRPSRIVHFVVDDDDAVERALAVVLGGSGHSFCLHNSTASFLAVPPEDPAGCIVFELCPPSIDGLAFQRRLIEIGICLPLIVLSDHADVKLAVAVLKAGAFDFIETTLDSDRILEAVAAAFDHCDRQNLRRAAIERVQIHLRTLSRREHEVLDGLLAGRPNKTIAQELGVSSRTIEVYRAKVMIKMQASSLSGLLRMALAAVGETDPESPR